MLITCFMLTTFTVDINDFMYIQHYYSISIFLIVLGVLEFEKCVLGYFNSKN